MTAPQESDEFIAPIQTHKEQSDRMVQISRITIPVVLVLSAIGTTMFSSWSVRGILADQQIKQTEQAAAQAASIAAQAAELSKQASLQASQLEAVKYLVQDMRKDLNWRIDAFTEKGYMLRSDWEAWLYKTRALNPDWKQP